ncbi:lachesin-like isoform X1 [Crassostrea virginica]
MNLNVLSAKPVITGGTESLTAALGSSASMACEAVGYPQPEISWYKRHGNMPRDYSVNEGALKIDRLRPQDAGTYICNAQNDMGKYEHTTRLVVGGKALHKKRCTSVCHF